MAIIKFIYTMFLFIFLFVIPTKVDGRITHETLRNMPLPGSKPIPILRGECISDAECKHPECDNCRGICLNSRCVCMMRLGWTYTTPQN
ncbi:hypothetical protein MtrunA17_Chr2g0309981 [Medicago truncatula]|uniref:Nodule Cysteine-Rich (NCR) secreted peptide n=1 Tax=Medicago truncatula TaxID=3880 RepID=A0A072UJS9_MEDTR|nr:Nodule Cysteine-Rich (NCR) secreted peptide [Medicago truncatula]RHN74408.1 hypothetical protein MtrunA17_Chr2g0309981 [Medicago truncatula]